jgi:hypothetical protein
MMFAELDKLSSDRKRSMDHKVQTLASLDSLNIYRVTHVLRCLERSLGFLIVL